jgi:hypothetical protein
VIRRLLAAMRTPVHDGPGECGRAACQVPGCPAKRGVCCEHCPVAYRRSQR